MKEEPGIDLPQALPVPAGSAIIRQRGLTGLIGEDHTDFHCLAVTDDRQNYLISG